MSNFINLVSEITCTVGKVTSVPFLDACPGGKELVACGISFSAMESLCLWAQTHEALLCQCMYLSSHFQENNIYINDSCK